MHRGTIGCILMRNSDQVERYHENVMKRTWPMLESCYLSTKRKMVINFSEGGPPSEIQFSYAESLDDVIRRFRSANFFDILVDQAEQFTEAELREIKQAVRWPDVPQGTCKLMLAFNMGGASISFLRKKFHLGEFNRNERPEDFVFTHVRPYDNVEWVRPALVADGLDEGDYYGWDEDTRKQYCATRSDYGASLVAQDEVLVKRDFEGSWESLEGSFFEHSFDRDAAVQPPDVCRSLIKPWWELWMSGDWGRGHYTAIYWHARGMVSPEEVKAALGWDIARPIKLVITYREYIAGGSADGDSGGKRSLDEDDIARDIVELTPHDEKGRIMDFPFSPDAFAQRTQDKTIAAKLTKGLADGGMRTAPRIAVDDRKSGWALMASMLLSAKRRGRMLDDAWIFSSNCMQLAEAIPLAMRSPLDLDDVLKTDKGRAKIEQDVLDGCFVGSTMVETEFGPQRIDAVREGMMVWTRRGLRSVSHSWLSRENTPIVRATFSDGTTLLCTSDHRIFIEDHGFIPIGEADPGSIIVKWESNCSTARSTTSGSQDISREEDASCIAKCGSRLMGRFLRATTSIIGIMLRRIIASRTSTVFWELYIAGCTRLPVPPSSNWPRYAHSLPLGTGLQRDAHGIVGTHWEESLFGPIRPASNAGETFLEHPCKSSAVQHAAQNGEGTRSSTTLRLFVRSVAGSRSRTNTTKPQLAEESAVRLCAIEQWGFADVFDLEIEDQPEFFANGVLVHNCRYGIRMMAPAGRKPKEVEAQERLDALRETGLDERSMAIYAMKEHQQLAVGSRPAQLSSVRWRGRIR